MTAALDALTRLDHTAPLPGDAAVLAVFERHCQDAQPGFCLICGAVGQGVECDACVIAHDAELRRLEDQ